jgi:hypothetical protein
VDRSGWKIGLRHKLCAKPIAHRGNIIVNISISPEPS